MGGYIVIAPAFMLLFIFVFVIVILVKTKKTETDDKTPIETADNSTDMYKICSKFIDRFNMACKISESERGVSISVTIPKQKEYGSRESKNFICGLLTRVSTRPDLINVHHITQKVDDTYTYGGFYPSSNRYDIDDDTMKKCMLEYIKEIERVYIDYTQTERQLLRTYGNE